MVCGWFASKGIGMIGGFDEVREFGAMVDMVEGR